jgi:hypothetical protein
METVRIATYFLVIILISVDIILVLYGFVSSSAAFLSNPRTGETAFVFEVLVLQALRLRKQLIRGNYPAIEHYGLDHNLLH